MVPPPSTLPRGTVTFLFTDIERSTELVRRLGAAFGNLRASHHAILRAAFAEHDGHEIDTAGDGFFVAFERAGDAVAAAVAAQHALRAAQEEGGPLRVRMGIHSAEPFVQDGAYLGVGVHRAARICAAGHGDQILLSNATAGIVEDLHPEGVELVDLGEHRLKDIARPQRLFQLNAPGLRSTFPPLKSLDSAAQPAIVTLMHTDIVGWGEILRALGDEHATKVARAYHAIVVGVIQAEGGRKVELVADSTMAAFERPRDALRAAVRARDALRADRWALDLEPPEVRIALHSGHVADPTARSLGSVAMSCVKLCAIAEPGQILVSHATEALLEGEIREVGIRYLGERTLTSLDHPVHIFEVA